MKRCYHLYMESIKKDTVNFAEQKLARRLWGAYGD